MRKGKNEDRHSGQPQKQRVKTRIGDGPPRATQPSAGLAPWLGLEAGIYSGSDVQGLLKDEGWNRGRREAKGTTSFQSNLTLGSELE